MDGIGIHFKKIMSVFMASCYCQQGRYGQYSFIPRNMSLPTEYLGRYSFIPKAVSLSAE
jgi:hypothetical protein